MSLRSLVLTSVAALALSAGAHATTFSLAGSVGATPTFSVTAGGVTATFTSIAGNGFLVQNTNDLFTFSTALVDTNTSFAANPLTISFSTPVSGTISIPFGFEDAFGIFGPDALTLTTNTGQTATFAASLNNLTFPEPEGVATLLLSGPTTSFTLTGTNPLGIGNITTTVAATPEPTSIVLLATGLAGMVVRRRRASSKVAID